MTGARKSRRPTGDYEVGYGRPPIAARFQPGQSGNPKGRKKGVKSAAETLREALLTKVTVKDNGRPKVMTKLELALHSAANAAARGDLRALRVLYDLARRGGDPLDRPAATSDVLTPDDLEVMQGLLARLAAPPAKPKSSTTEAERLSGSSQREANASDERDED